MVQELSSRIEAGLLVGASLAAGAAGALVPKVPKPCSEEGPSPWLSFDESFGASSTFFDSSPPPPSFRLLKLKPILPPPPFLNMAAGELARLAKSLNVSGQRKSIR